MHDRLLTGLAGHATASRGGFTADSRIPLRSSMKRQREEGCGSRFHPSLMDSRDKSSHTSTMGSGLSSLPYRMHMRVLCTWHGQGHIRVHTHWHTHWHTHAPREGSEEGNGHPNVYGQAARGRLASSRALAHGDRRRAAWDFCERSRNSADSGARRWPSCRVQPEERRGPARLRSPRPNPRSTWQWRGTRVSAVGLRAAQKRQPQGASLREGGRGEGGKEGRKDVKTKGLVCHFTPLRNM